MVDNRQESFSSYRLALGVNIFICVLQWVILFFANSISLFADAAHSFADSIALFGSALVSYQAMLLPEADASHIKRRMTRIAVILLWASVPFIVWASWERIHSPVAFPGIPVIIAALVSVVGNICMHRVVHNIDTHGHDHLVKANLAHILGDAMLSGGVLLSALLVVTLGTAEFDGYIGIACALWMIYVGAKIWGRTSGSSSAHSHNDAHEHHCDDYH